MHMQSISIESQVTIDEREDDRSVINDIELETHSNRDRRPAPG
jgi:hypothetical protein